MIHSIVVSLILTILIESVTSFLFGVRKLSDFQMIIAANIYTNPVVVVLTNLSMSQERLTILLSVLILEIGAIFIEKILFERYLSKECKPARLAIWNNIISFSIGILLYTGGI